MQAAGDYLRYKLSYKACTVHIDELQRESSSEVLDQHLWERGA